ncbi:MAG TPA: GumC family protein [Syntrophorhabdaceae bacterium]|nr:GumC family protein [Syntrophorhabdaceae bacterium]
MMEQNYQPFDFTNIRDLLTIVFKHKYKIFITFLVIFIGVTALALIMPRPYESKSVLLVKLGREFMNRPEVNGGSGFSVPPDTILRGEISILTSRDLISKVINTIGVEKLYPTTNKITAGTETPEQKAIKSFEENLSVTNVPGSSLIQVTFTHSDSYLAPRVVNTLVDAFKDKHLEVFSGNSTEFLENQQKAIEEKLKQSEGNLATFKQKHGVFSFDEQKTALIQQRSMLDTALKAAQNQMTEVDQKIAFIRSPKWMADTPQEMRSQLAALQQRERELSERYTDNSRAIQNVRQEIQLTKDAMGRNNEELRQIELGKAEGDLAVVKAKVENLKRQFSQVEGEVFALDARGRELQDLKREATQQEQSYDTYARKLQESLIMDDMDRHKMVAISVVEKATIPATPKKQKLDKHRMVAAGFLGGIAAGFALAFFLEFSASGMTTPYSAERRLGLPVMVAIAKKQSI